MASSLSSASAGPCIKKPSASIFKSFRPKKKLQSVVKFTKKSECFYSMKIEEGLSTYSPPLSQVIVQKSLAPLAAAVAVILWSPPASAGFLSGFSGIESVPGPQLPQIDFLNRINEENQKKYAEADARFKESPILKELLERSKLNKEKNRQAILDKYCIRGAEWGVGDCSADGMSPEDREKFISMLKQKAGVE